MNTYCAHCGMAVFVADDRESEWWGRLHMRIVHEAESILIVGDSSAKVNRLRPSW